MQHDPPARVLLCWCTVLLLHVSSCPVESISLQLSRLLKVELSRLLKVEIIFFILPLLREVSNLKLSSLQLLMKSLVPYVGTVLDYQCP